MIIRKIFGIPGGGKTTELIRCVEAERQGGVPLDRMAYLSFSKSAREVIKGRMTASVSDLRWFRTLHGACSKATGIGQNVVSPYDYRQFSEATGLTITPEDGEGYDWSPDQAIDYNVTLRALNLAATMCKPVEEIVRTLPVHRNLIPAQVQRFSVLWEDYKKQVGRFDYTDMLTKYDAEGEPLPIDVGFLDETQDLSELQWRVAHKLLRNAKRVYMAGDDDQAIYTFIGGSEYGFLDHPADEETILSKSWRVPKDIGERADQIIRKIAHRKKKTFEWKDEPGTVRCLNHDAMSLPWSTLIDRYESVMVLHRHRAGARLFSDDLKLVGVPHMLNGEAITSWKEAKLLHTYLQLKSDAGVTPHAAMELCKELGVDVGELRDLSRKKRVTRDMVQLDYLSPWITVFTGKNRKKLKRYETLRRLVNQRGHAALVETPKIAISTMHGSKGKEADLVIISPDCNNIVRQNVLTPAEIRLSYVSLTRAKREAIVLMPRTDTYITHLIGG